MNYKQSFRDGKAFIALCDDYIDDKDIFDYDKLVKDDPIENLSRAFETIETKLGVPKLLDPSEVSEGNVDERSLVLYMSLLFHAFTSKQQQAGIEEEKNKMELKMRGLEGSVEERNKIAAGLEAENKRLRDEVMNLNARIKSEQDAKHELKEKETYLEEKIEVLKQLMEQETEEKEDLDKIRYYNDVFE